MFGIFAVSTASIFIKFAQQEAASFVIAAYRLGLSTLVLAPIVWFRFRPQLAALSRKELRLGLLSGVFLAIHFASWITSLEYTSVASSVVLVTTTPLWVALASPLFLKESITKYVLWGMVLALMGTFVVGLSDVCVLDQGLHCPPLSEFVQGEAFLGDVLALIGAWAAAGYVLIGRSLRVRLSLVPYIFMVYGMSSLILLPLALLGGSPMVGFSSQTYLWLVLLALIPQLIGHSTINWALGVLPAAYVAVSLLGEPIGSSILAYFIFGEAPGVIKGFGAILILGGILVSSQVKIPKKPEIDL